MNPYQAIIAIGCCVLLLVGVVGLLVQQGVSMLVALLGVWIVAVLVMVGMQRRARSQYYSDGSKRGDGTVLTKHSHSIHRESIGVDHELEVQEH